MPAGAHTDAETTVPRLVEVWAPWCSVCKAMEDDLLAVADRFDGSVKLERVNAADQPDVVDQLGVMGTPTLIGFSGGAEVYRSTGRASPLELEAVFEALGRGAPLPSGARSSDLVLRFGSGGVLVALGLATGPSVPLVLVGVGVLSMAAIPYLRRRIGH